MLSFFKFLGFIFIAMAVASVGHDYWLTQERGSEFAFSQVGALFKLYAEAEHDATRQAIADAAGAETFNSLMVPILKTKTVLLTGVPGVFFALVAFIMERKRSLVEKESGNFRFKR